jgi:carbon storage regulator CsrA
MDPGLARDRRAADGLALAGRRRGIAAGRIYMEVSVLVLTRKEGEVVVVPEHGIEIHVVTINRDRVRLGFIAPDETDVFREEVWIDICNEEQEGTSHGAED